MNSQKVTNLKDKIEKEIKEIDNLYEKVEKQISEYFKIKHEELIKNENFIKDNLQNEVEETKGKLKEYLSFSNKIIKNIERINKGIELLEKDEKNMIKILTYISKINKNDKEMKKLNNTCMRNIKISFDEKENKIKYEEYFFNGNPSFKDIEYKDIDINTLKIKTGKKRIEEKTDDDDIVDDDDDVVDDDDAVDDDYMGLRALFGEETEEDKKAKDKMKKKNKEYKKKNKVYKSYVTLEVKGWDADQDLESLAKKIISTVKKDGLSWNIGYKLEEVAFGVKKLVISFLAEDEKCSVQEIVDELESWENDIQSVEVVLFNTIQSSKYIQVNNLEVKQEIEKVLSKGKKQNPLDLLPPSRLELRSFKRAFVNNKNKEDAMKKFWEIYDSQGYSLWRLEYQNLPSECKILFRTSNCKGIFLQACNNLRKYAFATHGVYGVENDYKIRGVWMFRGRGIPYQMKNNYLYKYITFRKLDHTKEKDRKLVHDYWTKLDENDEVEGRKCADVSYFI